jgi:hypothetical protein
MIPTEFSYDAANANRDPDSLSEAELIASEKLRKSAVKHNEALFNLSNSKNKAVKEFTSMDNHFSSVVFPVNQKIITYKMSEKARKANMELKAPHEKDYGVLGVGSNRVKVTGKSHIMFQSNVAKGKGISKKYLIHKNKIYEQNLSKKGNQPDWIVSDSYSKKDFEALENEKFIDSDKILQLNPSVRQEADPNERIDEYRDEDEEKDENRDEENPNVEDLP